MGNQQVTIGFRGTESYRNKLQQEALNRGVKVQRLIEEAVNAYLSGSSTCVLKEPVSEPLSAESAYWYGLLDDLLESPIKQFSAGIKSTLESWGVVARLVAKVTGDAQHTATESPEDRDKRIAELLRAANEAIADSRRDRAGNKSTPAQGHTKSA